MQQRQYILQSKNQVLKMKLSISTSNFPTVSKLDNAHGNKNSNFYTTTFGNECFYLSI